MPSTCFDYGVYPISEEDSGNGYQIENQSLIYLPYIYNNDSVGLANGKHCDLIPLETYIEIHNNIYVHGKDTQLITSKYKYDINRKLEVSTFLEENGTETLIFDVSFETHKDSGIYEYNHQHRYPGEYFTYICVEIQVLLKCKK